MNNATPCPGHSVPLSQAAAAIILRVFVCNIAEDTTAANAMEALRANQDADAGLEDLGLDPVDFARGTLSASDVEDIVLRAAGDIEHAAAGQGSAAAALHCALAEVLEQLDLIGVPDWHGAEGLSLVEARRAVIQHRQLSHDPVAIERHHAPRLELELEHETPTT